MFKFLSLNFLFLIPLFCVNIIKNVEFRDDDSAKRLETTLNLNSHIKIFLPSIPYSYISKNTNAALIRSSDNKKTWEYDLAEDIKRVDELTYIFTLRANLKFQNGEDFTVDQAIINLNYFKKFPFLYTNIDKIDFDVSKISKYKFKIVLKQKYEMFLIDLARVYFYTNEYLERFRPKGAETGTATVNPGPYGMGPYILNKGFALGSLQTDKLELIYNKYYWNKNLVKINKITVYTQLDVNKAIKDITRFEGKLDLMPIPFNKKIDVIMSKYSKLQVSQSTNTFLIFFNLINANKRLQNKDVRIALNQALNQKNLLNFVYKNEGVISPFAASINFKIVKKIAKEKSFRNIAFSKEKIMFLLKDLELNVLTQDRFMFLWKGIEFELNKYGVKLKYTITRSEKDIYSQLLNTKNNQNTLNWDMLIWGDDDWYYQDPWTVFFTYEPSSVWSTIHKDDVMSSYIKEYFITKRDTKEYLDITRKILFRAKEQAYNLIVPSPNKVIALNKEVYFKPYIGAIIPLWDIRITKDHWSIRENKKYSKYLEIPIKVKR